MGPLAGLSHGASGGALALLRLGTVTGEAAFFAGARRALAWERALRHPVRGWPDLRVREPRSLGNWCNGAAGVALVRLEALELDPESASDLELALDLAGAAATEGVDHPCCGALGCIEPLLVAGQRGHAKRRAQAVAIASTVVRRARAAGGYRLVGRGPDRFSSPGFFQGLAGIGYQLLRVAVPALPSVLAWA